MYHVLREMFRKDRNGFNLIELTFSSAAKKMQAGFTLIELIVVIAIIAILASFLMVNFVGIRERGRDAQRKSDMRQIQSALELYRADQGLYPEGDGTIMVDLDSNGSDEAISCGSIFYSPGQTITYMERLPCDPRGEGYFNSGSYYYYSVDGTSYELVGCLENSNDQDLNSTDTPGVGDDATPDCNSGLYFDVTNP